MAAALGPTGLQRGAGATLILLVLAAMTAGGGCYDPQLKSGQVNCGPGETCPDRFICRPADNKCVTADDGGAGAAGGSGTGGAGGTCADPIAPLCSGVPGRECDPVCQTGCACGLQCSYLGTGFGCTRGPAQPKTEGQVCSPTIDDCAPGFICLQDTCGTTLRRCHRSCSDATTLCTGVCNMAPTGQPANVKACSLPEQVCDPYAALGANGCPDPALNCFTDGSDTTFCDCPAAPAAQKPLGAPCTLAAECAPGLACLGVPGQPSACYQLCKPGSTSPCLGCTSFSRVGYCPL
jgi:hypothetical protein